MREIGGAVVLAELGARMLIAAAVAGDVEGVRQCLREGKHPDVDDDPNRARRLTPLVAACANGHVDVVKALVAATDRAARLYNRCQVGDGPDGQWAPVEVAEEWRRVRASSRCGPESVRHIVERQLAVRAEDSDDDDDAERTYAFPPPVDLDAYAEACRLPPAEETEDEREARFQRERNFGL